MPPSRYDQLNERIRTTATISSVVTVIFDSLFFVMWSDFHLLFSQRRHLKAEKIDLERNFFCGREAAMLALILAFRRGLCER